MPTSEVNLVMHYHLHLPTPLMSEAKTFVVAAVDMKTFWKHKVTPDGVDLII